MMASEKRRRTAYMRRWLLIFATIGALLALYYASAVIAVVSMARDVHQRRVADVLERTDLPALKRSIANQIIQSFLDQQDSKRQVGSTERIVIQTAGGSLADALVESMLTAENLTKLLGEGNLAATDKTPPLEIGNTSSFTTLRALDLLGRLGPSGLRRMAVRLTPADVEHPFEARFELQGLNWKLIDLRIPRLALRSIAEKVSEQIDRRR